MDEGGGAYPAHLGGGTGGSGTRGPPEDTARQTTLVYDTLQHPMLAILEYAWFTFRQEFMQTLEFPSLDKLTF